MGKYPHGVMPEQQLLDKGQTWTTDQYCSGVSAVCQPICYISQHFGRLCQGEMHVLG